MRSTLNKILSTQRIMIDLRCSVAQQISRAYTSSFPEILCPLISSSPFALTPRPWQTLFKLFDFINLTILDTSYK